MVFLRLFGQKAIVTDSKNYSELLNFVRQRAEVEEDAFYFERQGKIFTSTDASLDVHDIVHCVLRTNGGKGGFGSMLRAIGAQIEKTTNKEACRDLSGRRLRDINEEKQLKAWIEKQKNKETDKESRHKKKCEKLLSKPKHEFSDPQYEEARSKVSEKVNNAVEAGLLMAKPGTSKDLKRKAPATASKGKKAKSSLWLEDFSGSDSDSDTDTESKDDSPISTEAKVEDMATKVDDKICNDASGDNNEPKDVSPISTDGKVADEKIIVDATICTDAKDGNSNTNLKTDEI